MASFEPVEGVTRGGKGKDIGKGKAAESDGGKVKAVDDTMRVDFFKDYLVEVHAAIKAGADVRGYFAWSLLDNFEWALGYSKRFGLHYVDYTDEGDLERTPKASSLLLNEIFSSNTIPGPLLKTLTGIPNMKFK